MVSTVTVKYTFASLEEMATYVDDMAKEADKLAQSKNVTQKQNRYHAGERDAFRRVSALLRDSSIKSEEVPCTAQPSA